MQNQSRYYVPAAFFAALMLAGATLSVMAGARIVPEIPSPTTEDLVKGKSAVAFEKKFATEAPGYEPSRTLWGVADYLAFGEGRDGVIVGKNGWLFSSEEFSWGKTASANVLSNLAYVHEVNETLKEKNISLVVAVIPAKTRVMAEELGAAKPPRQRQDLYAQIMDDLPSHGIMVVDSLDNLRATPQSFLKTDTHWTPAGAKVTAGRIAEIVKVVAKGHEIPVGTTSFQSTRSKIGEVHSGDLLRYIPMGRYAYLGPQPDSLDKYDTTPAAEAATGAEAGNADDALFADTAIPYTLVGTSYSADKRWNFDGFLKESLGADLLNAADPGQGPFATMKAYLESAAFQDTPPQLIIWEMPERYFPISAPVIGDQQQKSENQGEEK